MEALETFNQLSVEIQKVYSRLSNNIGLVLTPGTDLLTWKVSKLKNCFRNFYKKLKNTGTIAQVVKHFTDLKSKVKRAYQALNDQSLKRDASILLQQCDRIVKTALFYKQVYMELVARDNIKKHERVIKTPNPAERSNFLRLLEVYRSVGIIDETLRGDMSKFDIIKQKCYDINIEATEEMFHKEQKAWSTKHLPPPKKKEE